MSPLSTTVVGTTTRVITSTVAIGPRGPQGPQGPAAVSFGGAGPNLEPIRFVGVLNHSGMPVTVDGTFQKNDVCWDSTGQQWLCVSAGTPGKWNAVGSGKVLGSVRLNTQFTMVAAGVTEDISGAFFTFTYDGRPLFFCTTPIASSIIPATGGKLLNLVIRRSSDNALVGGAYREQETTVGTNQIQPHKVEAGPFTAWPSDAVPFVVGTTYQVKLSMIASAGVKGATNGDTQAYTFYAITA